MIAAGGAEPQDGFRADQEADSDGVASEDKDEDEAAFEQVDPTLAVLSIIGLQRYGNSIVAPDFNAMVNIFLLSSTGGL